jgi:probable HAF family extracellular repeat protein
MARSARSGAVHGHWPVASLILLVACSVDDRNPGNAAGANAGGTSGASGNGGSGGTSPSGGSSGTSTGGSDSAPGGSGGSAGTSSEREDGGSSARGCGALGDACCPDTPRCDADLACDETAEVCTRCAAFRGVGILQGFTSSIAQGISGDGRVVVGFAEDGAGVTMAFRLDWASDAAAVPLGVLPGGVSSQARAASYDGYAVVGDSESMNGTRGFRWAAGVLTDLGSWAAGDVASHARDISADGNVVALDSEGADSTRTVYRRLADGDKALLLGMEEARGISADGNTLVGNRLGGSGNEAVLGDANGVEGLGALSGDTVAFARALSSDGNVAIGVSGSCGCRGFHSRDGVIDIAEGIERALAVNGDGSVIGGVMVAASCSGGRAAVFEPGPGTRAVACDLLPAGIIPNGWSLTSVNAISDDGRVIAGEGINPALAAEGWVAVIGPDCRTP